MTATTSRRRDDVDVERASAPPGAQAGLQVGRVIARGADNWLAQPQGKARAQRLRRAASCLLEPMAGDTVAWMPAQAGASAGWIVFVLERASAETPLELSVEGDLHLRVAGQWQVDSGSLHMESGDVRVRVQNARIGFNALRLAGELLEHTVQRTRWVGEEFSAVVSQWFQHSKSHRRHTEGIEQAQAGTLNLQAQQLARVEAPTVLTEGASLVKTRAAQIHFG